MPTSNSSRTRAFTLLELLTVIGIIALVLAILVPSLSGARRQGVSVKCKANLRTLITGIISYSAGASDEIVPSYNMTGVSGGPASPLDGWGPILDKMNIISGSDEMASNPFCCPATRDIAGMAATQTSSNPENPKGYMDWPAVITPSQNFASTIPSQGFDHIIRVSYWINADNPIGTPQTFTPDIHFTGSVGYGPDPGGKTMKFSYFTRLAHPSNLIALADGLYAGKQEATRRGALNSRIGYRHDGRTGSANIALADGHVDTIEGDRFPRKMYEGFNLAEIWSENTGERPSVYTDPVRDLHP